MLHVLCRGLYDTNHISGGMLLSQHDLGHAEQKKIGVNMQVSLPDAITLNRPPGAILGTAPTSTPPGSQLRGGTFPLAIAPVAGPTDHHPRPPSRSEVVGPQNGECSRIYHLITPTSPRPGRLPAPCHMNHSSPDSSCGVCDFLKRVLIVISINSVTVHL
jgi:hypothetical protein